MDTYESTELFTVVRAQKKSEKINIKNNLLPTNLSLNNNCAQTVPGFEEGRRPSQFINAQSVHQVTKLVKKLVQVYLTWTADLKVIRKFFLKP